MISHTAIQVENQLLAVLPSEEYQRLIPHLELVSLERDQVLYELEEFIEYVYFPSQALVSLITIMENGAVVEVGVVSREGLVGLPVCWGGNTTTNQAIVQIPGTALRLKAEYLKNEFDRGGKLQNIILRYMQALFTHTSHSAACNRLHTIEQRLARWLLTVQDRVQSDELPLTQEFLSYMLGTRRSGVTEAASALSQARMITYSRGKIKILDHQALESASCECYQVVKKEFARLLGTKYLK
ncbi:Crp/Fnr family transcriptional regulator [Chroogloeocystis siderophila]|jgi:CRP-like cAMP-binding protein|uniref:Crp/Fnr family transcriptional regulator n=1 Tax=Chroogloeocystis siderophila 5.2 s.c.1 TaxID=247279 RepID=A0A1U7I001_9CHRO|nr:Crp/Fnr family transcriptional regulator [Chroogloeocystis siderophila]OKH29214.1 Crp/Fnr family transcriptional regulator [Chroogloeocystis siderophila 5.2 s.c.1]